jgi:hypothetical protein
MIKKLAVLSTALILTLAFTNVSAKDNRIRLKCKANTGDGLSSMSAKHITREGRRRTREKFQASFEATSDFGYAEGDILQVNVAGEIVGTMTLAFQVNGDLGGDLDFDTNVDRDQPDTTVPFPANWPGAEKGSIVMVGTLGCSLQ